jgi:hypothetical protein
MKMVKIIAKEGMRIRIPAENYRVLPKEGAVVQWNMHWAKAKERGEIDVEDVAVEPAEARDQTKVKAKGPRPREAGGGEVSKPVHTPGVAVS